MHNTVAHPEYISNVLRIHSYFLNHNYWFYCLQPLFMHEWIKLLNVTNKKVPLCRPFASEYFYYNVLHNIMYLCLHNKQVSYIGILQAYSRLQATPAYLASMTKHQTLVWMQFDYSPHVARENLMHYYVNSTKHNKFFAIEHSYNQLNESTAGADASVEALKLHYMKLTLALIQ